MLITWLMAFQLQSQMDPVRPSDVARLHQERQERAIEAQRVETEVRTKREFQERFNKLITALAEFTREYNGSNGSVWPHKKALTVDKAIKAFQTSTTWKQMTSEAK